MTSRRRLGQHFLTDPNILRKIVDALDPAPTDLVLEIGAGRGSLTGELLARGLQVIAIEKDRRLAAPLKERGAGSGTLRIVEGDALRMNWHDLVRQPSGPAPRSPLPSFKVVGNIPYAITSPLIEKALTPPLPQRIVFLVQSEVADRVAARPGAEAYGALSVGVQAVCRVERLFSVKPGAFHPPPQVASAVLRLTPLSEPLVAREETGRFRAFVAACFSRRRKQLRNVVMAATGRGATDVVAGLGALGLDPAARPETLAPAAFARLLRWSG
ncbi:MAG: 16S rRNA (adenine(1518)-N(6)/adenine(1519)-N(6))-dimethyltransferase RsmA [Gemmatimonadales bacterium]